MRHLQTDIRKRATFAKSNDKQVILCEDDASSTHALLALILLAMALLVVWPSQAQNQEAAQGSNHASHGISMSDLTIAGQQAKQQQKLSVALNAERQKSMISDANKLLGLARELNAELSNGGSSLSPSQQAHKAAEIEKLAHNVKQKMSFAAGAPAAIDSPFNASIP